MTETFLDIIICTDSLSVITALQNPKKKLDTNIFILNIMKYIDELMTKNINVKFVWAKGHANIRGNEKADHIAKNFQDYSYTLLEEFNPSDFYHLVKQNIHNKWQERWHSYGNKSNTTYYNIHRDIPKCYWYNNIKTNRHMVATIARLKTNHGRFPAHLNKIGITQSPQCTCSDVVGDLNHIFFNCIHNSIQSSWLMEILRNEGFQEPMWLPLILIPSNARFYYLLILFLKKIDLLI